MKGVYLFFALMMAGCGSEKSESAAKTNIKREPDRPSKWTEKELEAAATNYKGSAFQKYQVLSLAKGLQYDYTPAEFQQKIKSGEVKDLIKGSINTDAINYPFDVDKIAGKSPKQIVALFGEPALTETVNPSRTPCPCPKKTYLDGLVEIVYMKGKADWITIKVGPSTDVDSKQYNIKRFEDYAYIKAFTD